MKKMKKLGPVQTLSDTDGNRITISRSSAVAVGNQRGPFVWIEISARPENLSGTAHLTKEHAIKIAAALLVAVNG